MCDECGHLFRPEELSAVLYESEHPGRMCASCLADYLRFLPESKEET
jgi:hypothetical protein